MSARDYERSQKRRRMNIPEYSESISVVDFQAWDEFYHGQELSATWQLTPDNGSYHNSGLITNSYHTSIPQHASSSYCFQYEHSSYNGHSGHFGYSLPHNVIEQHRWEIQQSTQLVNLEERLPDEVVCFGMITDIPAECELPTRSNLFSSSSVIPARFDTSSRFSLLAHGGIAGSASSRHSSIVQAMLDEPSLVLQVLCEFGDQAAPGKSRSLLHRRVMPCSLSIILYGPLHLSDDLRVFFDDDEDCEVFLQDPHSCDLNVRYCNPQRLSSSDIHKCPMTFDLGVQSAHTTASLVEFAQQPDLLAILNFQDILPEALQPEAIHTPLQSHQKQALTFILRREQGWAFDGDRPDLWDYNRKGQQYYFINRIADTYQLEEPPQFFGGIIADPMGLGKTLTMIALIATDLPGYPTTSVNEPDGTQENAEVHTTLVVVPPPLLDTWEEQLSQHVKRDGLTWVRQHGKSRLTTAEVRNANLVLTTYHTVSTEWKKGKEVGESILFQTKWKRVVLDEAHFIRNSTSQMAKAICALRAKTRWAVTGTPIQNRLGDLTSLLKFLQAYPYDDAQQFDNDITTPWKTGKPQEAVARLQKLAGCLILRRPKEAIDLPPRIDLRCEVEFDHDERRLYDEVKTQAISMAHDALGDSHMPQSVNFINVIQQINTLRLICDMGMYYHSRHEDFTSQYLSSSASHWNSVAQETFNFESESRVITCHSCSTAFNPAEALLGWDKGQENPLFSECLRFICSECVSRYHTSRRPISCGHSPAHLFTPVSTNIGELDDAVEAPTFDEEQTMPHALPSKVTSLMKQLREQPAGTKSIVFSTWRMTLNVIEVGLKQCKISFLRYDGKVPQKERQTVIERFRKDPSIKVMLLTLACGAVGLTLTEASFAYLMEPHWNPTIEEQALARIHRLGQKRQVTTVRFVVKDTFEERVMQIQQSKRDLSDALFAKEQADTAGQAERLKWLCDLL